MAEVYLFARINARGHWPTIASVFVSMSDSPPPPKPGTTLALVRKQTGETVVDATFKLKQWADQACPGLVPFVSPPIDLETGVRP